MNIYLNMLIEELSKHDVAVHVTAPRGHLCRTAKPFAGLPKLLAYVDKYLIFPVKLFFVQFGYDRVHICDHSNSVYSLVLFDRLVTVTCHDVLAVESALTIREGKLSSRLLQRAILWGLGKCNAIYCVSKYTATHLMRLQPNYKHKVADAIHMISPFYRRDVAFKKELTRHPLLANLGTDFILHVGSDLPRKNRKYAIEIFAELKLRPAFVGTKLLFVGPKLESEAEHLARSASVLSDIVCVQGIEPPALRALYSAARFLVFPSVGEGFGAPVPEAQACGCPVFAMDNEPLPEIGGDAARYFPANAPSRAAEIILAANLADMRELGFANAARFSQAAATAEIFGLQLLPDASSTGT